MCVFQNLAVNLSLRNFENPLNSLLGNVRFKCRLCNSSFSALSGILSARYVTIALKLISFALFAEIHFFVSSAKLPLTKWHKLSVQLHKKHADKAASAEQMLRAGIINRLNECLSINCRWAVQRSEKNNAVRTALS